MVRFFSKLMAFVLLTSVPYFYFSLKKAQKDSFYWKTTYPASSLIIGASRVQMGIDPAIIEEELQLDHKVLNLAFSGTTSPYGSLYLDFIKRKLKPRKQNDAIFILSVNPGLISSYIGESCPTEEDFRVYEMWNVNIHPNLEYLARNPRGDILIENALLKMAKNNKLSEYLRKTRVLAQRKPLTHDSNRNQKRRANGVGAGEKRRPAIQYLSATGTKRGFTEVIYSDESLRIIDSINYSPKVFATHEPSEKRLQYLEQTIDYLKTKGNVFLVRTPETEAVVIRSNNYMPDFTEKMQLLATRQNVYFLDYCNRTKELNYHLYDNLLHLEARSSRAFSKRLCADIRQLVSLPPKHNENASR